MLRQGRKPTPQMLLPETVECAFSSQIFHTVLEKTTVFPACLNLAPLLNVYKFVNHSHNRRPRHLLQFFGQEDQELSLAPRNLAVR